MSLSFLQVLSYFVSALHWLGKEPILSNIMITYNTNGLSSRKIFIRDEDMSPQGIERNPEAFWLEVSGETCVGREAWSCSQTVSLLSHLWTPRTHPRAAEALPTSSSCFKRKLSIAMCSQHLKSNSGWRLHLGLLLKSLPLFFFFFFFNLHFLFCTGV